MKIIYTGLESAGKSLLASQKILYLIKRNKYFKKKYGFHRPIFSNIKVSDDIIEKSDGLVKIFRDKKEVINQVGCDIIWDEISTDFPAEKREPLPVGVNRWFRQGAKQGVHLYAMAQEFHDCHVQLRRRFLKCYNVKKFIGSERPGVNWPKPSFIWGICLIDDIKIHPYNEIQPERLNMIPKPLFITKFLCSVFDTNQVIDAGDNTIEVEHSIEKCNICDYERIKHR